MRKVKLFLLALINGVIFVGIGGCSLSVPLEELNSVNIETRIETEAPEQFASATLMIEIESTKILTATVSPTDALIESIPGIETEQWFEENQWQNPTGDKGFAEVLTIPAVIYSSPQDAVEKGLPKRTIPGDEVYISFILKDSYEDETVFEVEEGGWMAGDQLSLITPSSFTGIIIQDIPVNGWGWVVEPTFSSFFDDENSVQQRHAHYYQRYQLFTVLSQVTDEKGGIWYEIAPGEWISDDHFSFVRLREILPSQVISQRWIGVNLTEQNLVVYEAGKPIFATLISTGAKHGWTYAGVFTVFNMLETHDLFSPDPKEIGNYYLEDVPWILFYEGSLAIHGAYWHDSFGLPNSHGCVNMSIRDAGWLYEWAKPSDYVFLFW